MSLNGSDTLLFEAQGWGTGEGGQLTIEKVNQFNVHARAHLDGGPSASTSVPYGKVTLNGIVLQQWKTGYTSFPFTYWKSVVPNTSPDGTVAGYANSLDPDVLAQLDNETRHYQLYYMDNYSEFNTFFHVNAIDGGTAGYTVPPYLITLYRRVDLGGGLQTIETASGVSTIKEANTAHEIGHAMDHVWGNASQQTGSGSFGEALNTDVSTGSAGYINYESCATVFATATSGYLDICSAYSGTNAEKLLQWVGGNAEQELFAHLFQKVTKSGKGNPQLEHALQYLPTAKGWVEDEIDDL